MTPLVQGVLVFVVFTAVTAAGMLVTVVRERQENPGANILPKLLPYLVADGLFIIVFVIWLLNQG